MGEFLLGCNIRLPMVRKLVAGRVDLIRVMSWATIGQVPKGHPLSKKDPRQSFLYTVAAKESTWSFVQATLTFQPWTLTLSHFTSTRNPTSLSAGADIMSWTFALLKQIDFAGDSTGPSFPRSTLELKDAVESTDRDSRYGTLSMYRSSPDVQRYFCSRCSASVFYAVDDRPDLVDVAVGLLHSPDGARAESILAWHLGAKMMGEEDHKGGWREGFVNAVKETSEKWRLENGYPKTWARVKSESSSKVT
jgi:hypothetical protein